MAYFEGEWKRRPAQRPTGVQFSTDISRVIRIAREQQQQRASDKRRLTAATVIESAARGFLARRRLVRQRRTEFHVSFSNLIQSKLTGQERWKALRLFTSFALSASGNVASADMNTADDVVRLVQICHQAVTRWRNDIVNDLHAGNHDRQTFVDKRRVFAQLLAVAASSIPLLLQKNDAGASTASAASAGADKQHNRQDLNTVVRFLDVFTDAKTFVTRSAGTNPSTALSNDEARAIAHYLLLQMMKNGSFSDLALFRAENLIGAQVEAAAAERARESRQLAPHLLSWLDKIQLETDVMHRNVVAHIILRLLYRPLLYAETVLTLEDAVHATVRPMPHGNKRTSVTTRRNSSVVLHQSEFLLYIKSLFAWPAYNSVPFHIRHLSSLILQASADGSLSAGAAEAAICETLLRNMSFVLKTLFSSGLNCSRYADAKDAYDNFFYHIMHDDDKAVASNRRLSLLFSSIQLQQAWSNFQSSSGDTSAAGGSASFQTSMLDIISALLKSTVIATGIESLVNEDNEDDDMDEKVADDDDDIIMRDDTKHAVARVQRAVDDKTTSQLSGVEQQRITLLRQMCVSYLTTHQDFQRFYIECFVSVASSLSAQVLSAPPSDSRNLRVMDETLALSIWHAPTNTVDDGKTNGDLIMTLVSVYYGLMQIGSTLQLFSYVRNSPLLPILWAVLSSTKRDITGRGRFVLTGAANSGSSGDAKTTISFGGFGIATGAAAKEQRQQQQTIMDLLKNGTVMPLRECHDFVICLDVFCAMMEPLLLSVHDRDFYESALSGGEANDAGGSLMPPVLFTIQEKLQQQQSAGGVSSGLPFNNLELALIARDLRSVGVGMAQLAFASTQRRVFTTSIMNTSATGSANSKSVSQSWNDTEQWWSCFLSASALLRKMYDRDQRRPFTWLTYAYDAAVLRQHYNNDADLTTLEKWSWDRQATAIPSLSGSLAGSANKMNLLILPEIIANSAQSDGSDAGGGGAAQEISNFMPFNDKNRTNLLPSNNLSRFGDDIVRQFFKIARPFQPPPPPLSSTGFARNKTAKSAAVRPRVQPGSRSQQIPLDFGSDFGAGMSSEDDFEQPVAAAAMPSALPAVSAAAHSADELAVTLLLLQTPFVVPFVERVRYFHQWLQLEHRRRGHDIRANFGVGPGEQLQAIRRDHVYEDAFEQLSHLQPERFRLLWSVSFRNLTGLLEAGIDGGGLFREFCNLVLKEGLNPHRGFFQLTAHDGSLLPNATVINAMDESGEKLLGVSVFEHLRFLGRILGKCLYEMLLVEVRFAKFFLRQLLLPRGRNYVDIHQLQSFDPEMYRNLMLLRDLPDVRVLDLDFSVNVDRLGQTRVYELKPGGSSIPVTNENRNEYIHLYADFWLNRHARRAVNAVKMGLEEVIPYQWLALFAPHELQMLMSGVDQPVDVEDLKHHTHYTGQYNDDHPVIKNFWSVVRSMSDEQKRLLLKFVTSCSRPPLFGFKELHPPFTIQSAARVDGLPTSSTCMNLLKLPEFGDAQTLRAKLVESITSGAGFELS